MPEEDRSSKRKAPRQRQQAQRESQHHQPPAHETTEPQATPSPAAGVAALLDREAATLSPEDVRALQRSLPNSAIARLATSGRAQAALRREMVRRVGPDGDEGGTSPTFPINLDRAVPLGGGYQAHLQLQATLRWNPFALRVDGEDNGLRIEEDGEERANLRFGSGGAFRSLGVDTGQFSAGYSEEEGFDAGAEAGPVSASIEGREAEITVDALGIIWSQRMQEMVEEVGEVTSDFTFGFAFPTGEDVRLTSAEADLGVSFGPEQARLLGELNIATQYGARGESVTAASGRLAVEVNVLGMERTFTLFEGEGRAASISRFGARYESTIVEMALRHAFGRTAADSGAAGDIASAEASVRYLVERFNGHYREGYTRVRQAVIDHFAGELEVEADSLRLMDTVDTSRGTPLNYVPRAVADRFDAVTVNPYCRARVTSLILPDPDPPGAAEVDFVWNYVVREAAEIRGDLPRWRAMAAEDIPEEERWPPGVPQY